MTSGQAELLEKARQAYRAKQITECTELLTQYGVPDWVTVRGMPGNSLSHRLEWLLLRRKPVLPGETGGDTWSDAEFLTALPKEGGAQ